MATYSCFSQDRVYELLKIMKHFLGFLGLLCIAQSCLSTFTFEDGRSISHIELLKISLLHSLSKV